MKTLGKKISIVFPQLSYLQVKMKLKLFLLLFNFQGDHH